MTEQDFLQAIIDDPFQAESTWLVLADWLEERGDPRFELVRLQHDDSYRSRLSTETRDERIRALLASGMMPVAPTVTNAIGMTLALIPKGTFLMGSLDSEGSPEEHPQHEAEITKAFYLGVYQVTQEEYQKVMGVNPSWFSASGNGKSTSRLYFLRDIAFLDSGRIST
jgi:uncharacterized protein (TIGR02996 family)